VIEEKLLYLIEQLIVCEFSASVGLDVDLIDLDLTGDDLPCALEIMRIPHLLDYVFGNIDGDFKVFISAGGGGSRKGKGLE
jgi:hypothetical protein